MKLFDSELRVGEQLKSFFIALEEQPADNFFRGSGAEYAAYFGEVLTRGWDQRYPLSSLIGHPFGENSGEIPDEDGLLQEEVLAYCVDYCDGFDHLGMLCYSVSEGLAGHCYQSWPLMEQEGKLWLVLQEGTGSKYYLIEPTNPEQMEKVIDGHFENKEIFSPVEGRIGYFTLA